MTPTKPILKVRVGSGPRDYRRGCWVYLMSIPGQFAKIGHSANPLKRRDDLQEELGGEEILVAQARFFETRGEAWSYENALHQQFANHRIARH